MGLSIRLPFQPTYLAIATAKHVNWRCGIQLPKKLSNHPDLSLFQSRLAIVIFRACCAGFGPVTQLVPISTPMGLSVSLPAFVKPSLSWCAINIADNILTKRIETVQSLMNGLMTGQHTSIVLQKVLTQDDLFSRVARPILQLRLP